jgi:hypothetical protein
MNIARVGRASQSAPDYCHSVRSCGGGSARNDESRPSCKLGDKLCSADRRDSSSPLLGMTPRAKRSCCTLLVQTGRNVTPLVPTVRCALRGGPHPSRHCSSESSLESSPESSFQSSPGSTVESKLESSLHSFFHRSLQSSLHRFVHRSSQSSTHRFSHRLLQSSVESSRQSSPESSTQSSFQSLFHGFLES